jgi:uncharacterized membrane protein
LDSFIDYIAGFELTCWGKVAITFLISLLPVAELRAAIPVGVSLGLPVLGSAAVSVAGNILPVPFIILFARRVFAWMSRRASLLRRLAASLERRAGARGDMLYKGAVVGLIVFVAVPLPGTGAWTGALIAAVLDIRMKTALPAIGAGVIIAGVLVSGVTIGFKTIF